MMDDHEFDEYKKSGRISMEEYQDLLQLGRDIEEYTGVKFEWETGWEWLIATARNGAFTIKPEDGYYRCIVASSWLDPNEDCRYLETKEEVVDMVLEYFPLEGGKDV